ncbi:MAG: nucleoside-diphosphate kinase [Gemmatimonadota bacterium]
MPQRTLAIIKPDAVSRNATGSILSHLEGAGFEVRALEMLVLSRAEAERFYAVHSERAFFGSLVAFMTSGPCVPMVLEREDAVASLRKAIGATDPAEAEAGTVRALFAESKERNAIHASDSAENAAREIAFFFPERDLTVWSDAAATRESRPRATGSESPGSS